MMMKRLLENLITRLLLATILLRMARTRTVLGIRPVKAGHDEARSMARGLAGQAS